MGALQRKKKRKKRKRAEKVQNIANYSGGGTRRKQTNENSMNQRGQSHVPGPRKGRSKFGVGNFGCTKNTEIEKKGNRAHLKGQEKVSKGRRWGRTKVIHPRDVKRQRCAT